MSETEVTAEGGIQNTDDLDAFSTEFFGENDTGTPAAKPEAEQETAKKDEPDATEAQTDNDELTDDDEAEAEKALAEQPKKSKVQERIDELVKQREDAKREAAAERKSFEEKLAALEARIAPPAAVPKTEEPTPDAMNEDGTPKYDLGEFDPAYIRDLTRYTLAQERSQAEQKAAEQSKQREADAQRATLAQGWTEKVTEAKTRYPDLEEKGTALLNGFQNLQPEYADYLSTVLMSMDFGPDVLHYLADNPAEAATIVNSGATKATIALGRIEAKYAEDAAQKQLAKPKMSKAPPPPSVSARGTGGGAKSIEADTDDLDAFSAEFFRKKR